MPLFDHRCRECGNRFEVLVSLANLRKPQPCPACDSEETIRLVTPSRFSLKGGGWAKDGYGRGGDE